MAELNSTVVMAIFANQKVKKESAEDHIEPEYYGR
jgi:hypothetical protein